MAGERRAFVIYLVAIDIEHGLWCDKHQLPGAYELTFHQLTERGVSAGQIFVGCDCG